jgi:VCBS repeat-containing protein
VLSSSSTVVTLPDGKSAVLSELTETNAPLTTSGNVTVTDLDAGENKVIAQTGTAGTYGTFTVTENGAWTYTTSSALNQLNAGQVVNEIFTLTSKDGTATIPVIVKITGSNDTASATVSAVAAVNEAAYGTTGATVDVNVANYVTITDADTSDVKAFDSVSWDELITPPNLATIREVPSELTATQEIPEPAPLSGGPSGSPDGTFQKRIIPSLPVLTSRLRSAMNAKSHTESECPIKGPVRGSRFITSQRRTVLPMAQASVPPSGLNLTCANSSFDTKMGSPSASPADKSQSRMNPSSPPVASMLPSRLTLKL